MRLILIAIAIFFAHTANGQNSNFVNIQKVGYGYNNYGLSFGAVKNTGFMGSFNFSIAQPREWDYGFYIGATKNINEGVSIYLTPGLRFAEGAYHHKRQISGQGGLLVHIWRINIQMGYDIRLDRPVLGLGFRY